MADGNSTGDAALDGLLGIGATPSTKPISAPHAPTGDAALDGLLAQQSAAPSSAPSATPPDQVTPIAPRPRGHYNINHLGTPAERSPASLIGTGEALLHGLTSVPAGFAGWLTGLAGAAGGSQSPKGDSDLPNELTGAQEAVSSALTYHPTTPEGQRLAQGFDQVLGAPGRLIQSVIADPIKRVLPASSGPGVDFAAQNFAPLLVGPALKGIKAAVPAIARIGTAPVQPWDTATGAPTATGGASTGFGADTASAARVTRVGALPQNIQAHVQAAGPDANLDAAERLADLERMGLQGTPGEISLDPGRLRREFEDVNATQEGARRISRNNAILTNELTAARADVAGESAGLNNQDLARGVERNLQEEGAQRRQDIQDAYGRVAGQYGGALPADLRATADAVTQDLRANGFDSEFIKQHLFPLRVMESKAAAAAQNAEDIAAGRTVSPEQLRQGQYTVEDMMHADRNLSGLQTSTDANVRRMAGIMKPHVMDFREDPAAMGNGADAAQARADLTNAKSLARDNFQRLEQDRAYRQAMAALDSGQEVNHDTFMRNFDNPVNINATLRTLAGNDEAAQQISAYQFNRVLQAARVDADAAQTGTVAPGALGTELRTHEAAIQAGIGPNASERVQLVLRNARTLNPDYRAAGANISRSGTNAANRLIDRSNANIAQTAADMTQHAIGLASPSAGGLMGIARTLHGLRSEARVASAARQAAEAFQNETLNHPEIGISIPAPGAGVTRVMRPLNLRQNPYPAPPAGPGPVPGGTPPPPGRGGPIGGPTVPPGPTPAPAPPRPPGQIGSGPNNGAPMLPPPTPPGFAGRTPTAIPGAAEIDMLERRTAQGVAEATVRRQQRDAAVASALRARGIEAAPEILWDVDTALGNSTATPEQAVDKVIEHWGKMEQDLPRTGAHRAR